MALTIEQIQSLDRASLDRMTSDQYKENFDAATNPNSAQFRARIEAIENGPRQATRKAGSVRQDAPTPAQTTFSNDPSWADEEQPNQPAAAVPPQPAAATSAQPAVASAAVDESLPELTYEYQPVSKITGKAVGGLQRFKYRTKDELIEKLAAAHSAASSRIRELSRNKKLEEIVSSGPTEKNFTPSTEVPKTMEELAKELLEQRQQNFLLAVRESLNNFQLSADWAKYRSNPENARSLVLAIERAGDDPSRVESYHTAFSTMREYLIAEEPTAVPAPTPTPVAAQPVLRASNTPRLASGLSSADSFNPEVEAAPVKVPGVRIVMPSGKTEVLTLAAYDKLSTDVQKRILRNGSNQAAIEALTVAEDQAKAARRGGR